MLCDSFIWFINFKSSNSQIFRSSYHCYQDFNFYENTQFIMHFDSDGEKWEPILSLPYKCINYEYFQEDDEIGFIKFSKVENYILYQNKAGKLKIYYVQGKCVIKKFKIKDLYIDDARFSINNKRLIIFYQFQNREQSLDLLTIQDHQNIFRIQIPTDINNKISAFEISNDEDYLMIAKSDSKLYYISIDKMEIVFTIDDLENYVSAIAFSSSQKEFALGLIDGSLKLYDFNKQLLVQQSNLEEKKYTYRPICIKIFSRLPQLMAYGCKLNEKTKIENKDGQSLVQILISEQAEMIKNEE